MYVFKLFLVVYHFSVIIELLGDLVVLDLTFIFLHVVGLYHIFPGSIDQILFFQTKVLDRIGSVLLVERTLRFIFILLFHDRVRHFVYQQRLRSLSYWFWFLIIIRQVQLDIENARV